LIGVALVIAGVAAFGWCIVYAIASTAAPPDMKLPLSQYICFFGGAAAFLIGIGLIVVGIVRRIRHAKSD
jgi:hypothetical protein